MQTRSKNPQTYLILMLNSSQQAGRVALTFCRASHCEALVDHLDMLALCAKVGEQPMPFQRVSV